MWCTCQKEFWSVHWNIFVFLRYPFIQSLNHQNVLSLFGVVVIPNCSPTIPPPLKFSHTMYLNNLSSINWLKINQLFVFISTSTILIMCDDTTLIVSRGRQNHKQHVSRWKLWTTGSRMFLCGIKAKHGNGSKKYCMLYEYHHILLPKIRYFFLSKPNIKCVIHIKNKVSCLYSSFLLPHQKGNTKSW